ncbi:MAG: hypothetical protein Q4G25_15930 [Paracoccus sp. (in: a-proteobacteria)]|nr:hypothetical protein [Paracoccus sp. (in: a-proteobacteria)]
MDDIKTSQPGSGRADRAYADRSLNPPRSLAEWFDFAVRARDAAPHRSDVPAQRKGDADA